MCIDMYRRGTYIVKFYLKSLILYFWGCICSPYTQHPIRPACMVARDARQVVFESINMLNFCRLHVDIKSISGLTDDNRHRIPNGCMSSFLNLFIAFPTLTHYFSLYF